MKKIRKSVQQDAAAFENNSHFVGADAYTIAKKGNRHIK